MTSSQYHTERAVELREIAIAAFEAGDWINAPRFSRMADVAWSTVRELDPTTAAFFAPAEA